MERHTHSALVLTSEVIAEPTQNIQRVHLKNGNGHAPCNNTREWCITSNHDQECPKVLGAIRSIRYVDGVPDEKQEEASVDERGTNLEFIRVVRTDEKDDC